MRSITSRENPVGFLGNLARALVIGLLASLLTLVTAAQEAKATGAIVYNDNNCQLSDAGYQGTGAEEDPYVISDSESLWEVADCSLTTSGAAAHFSISNDINVSEAVSAPTHSPIGLTYDPTSDPVVLQWTAFFGVLRGNGHTISGISMSSETGFVGLFAQMHDATVENLAIAGTFSTAAETYETLPLAMEIVGFGSGALAALSSGHMTMSGVVNSASVIASKMVGVGGLIGASNGIVRVHSSSNLATVSGSDAVGGLIGKANGAVFISESTNRGRVSAHFSIGGLLGWGGLLDAPASESQIVDSSNHGLITGAFAGGLVGEFVGIFTEASTASLMIQNSQNTATVSGPTVVGGLVGTADFVHFYNSGNTGPISGENGVGGLFGGYVSFNNDDPDNPQNDLQLSDGTPDLTISSREPIAVPSKVSVQGSFNSGTVSGRDNVGGLVGASSDSSIDFSTNSGIVSGRYGSGGLIGSMYGAGEISSASNQSRVDGEWGTSGLIGSIISDDPASVAVRFSNNSGNIHSTVGGAGGLVGQTDDNLNLVIFKSTNDGDITGGSYLGGLVGQQEDGVLSIESSQNNGNVTSSRNNDGITVNSYDVGGLVGSSTAATHFSDSRNTGNVTGEEEGVGGLIGIGYSATYFIDSHNTGSISGSSSVGGLMGYVDGDANINSSFNSGPVFGAVLFVGGLVGNVDGDANINSSFNNGTVTGALSFVGGFLGDVDDGVNITSSFNSGTVSGGVSFVGGFVGAVDGGVNITSSFNAARVSGEVSFVGGFMGNSNASSNIASSYNSGAVTGSSFIGGFMGSVNASSNIDSSYNSGTVTGFTFLGGFAGSIGAAASISNSFNSGTVSSAGSFLGGFAGSVGSVDTDNSFNAGTVSGSGFVGGLVGAANVFANFANSYNAGTVSGSGFVDGLAGDVSGPSITTSVHSSVASDFVATSTTTELQRASTFNGFDFTNTWGFGSCSDNRGFPMLRVFEGLTDYNSVGCVDPTSSPATPTQQQVGSSSAGGYFGPTLDANQPRGIIGSEVVLTGQRLGAVTGLRIGGVFQVITLATERSIRFTVSSDTKLGVNDIVLVSSFGTLTLQSAIQIESPSASVATATKSALVGKTRMLSKNSAVNQSWFAANLKDSGLTRIACTVLVSPNATHHQRVQARKQASRVCAQAAGHLETATVWFQTRETTRSRMPGRALITFRG